ncbi:hypothetical protein KQH65_08500 [archaeon]|nr:hypothetical protein [archaeon]
MKLVLKVFEDFTATLSKGDPLVIRISLMNTDGLEEYQRNQGIDEDVEELRKQLEAEEITEEEYKEQVTQLEEKKTNIDYPVLGSDETPWSEQINFSPDWFKPALLSREPDQDIFTLTPKTTAYAMFGLSPEETENLENQIYRIKASLGDEESNEVGFIVTDEEPELDMEKLAEKARNMLLVGGAAKGLQLIEGILEKNPQDIDGLILMGDYHAMMGEKEAAIAAYQNAIAAYNATNPREDDPPGVLISKLNRLTVRSVNDEKL